MRPEEISSSAVTLEALEAQAVQNPLLALNTIRRIETKQLFANFSSDSDETTLDKHMQSTLEAERTKEVACAPLLKRWRDSVRDLPCSLYSFATLNDSNLDLIARTVQNQRIVEMGAGTGYLSKLLSTKLSPPSSIKAFDLNLDTNEYHGLVRPFLQVNLGDGAAKMESDCVLLLCYPPPDSSMGLATLESFAKCGGDLFIHVGEFKGLTGTPAFEANLRQNWNCEAIENCAQWGNDATCVSVWRKKKKGGLYDNLTFPLCGVCKSSSGTKRCRFNSSLVYCDELACYEKGAEARDALLKNENVEVVARAMVNDSSFFMKI